MTHAHDATSGASPHLAHHFDDLDQQKDACTLGMWAFLATELMFFGGMFLGFSVYRHRYTEAFSEAARHLSVTLGCINTFVLLTSSFTVVLAVHYAGLGNRKALIGSLIATLVLGCTFLGIKANEYYIEYKEQLIPGLNFTYGNNPERMPVPGEHAHANPGEPAHELFSANPRGSNPVPRTGAPASLAPAESAESGAHADAAAGAHEAGEHAPRTPAYANQAKIFMSFYFVMTGVHATHMIIGVGLFIWLLIDAYRNKYSAEYFIPVENVGLYWHFVDIIWIFVFPILYLLHY